MECPNCCAEIEDVQQEQCSECGADCCDLCTDDGMCEDCLTQIQEDGDTDA